MKYTIQAHPTLYGGVQFRSRLEARWAAFFDLTGCSWQYEPVDLHGWSPDFQIEMPNANGGVSSLLVEVKPWEPDGDFSSHHAYELMFQQMLAFIAGAAWTTPSPALFGAHPRAAMWFEPEAPPWITADPADAAFYRGLAWPSSWAESLNDQQGVAVDCLWKAAGNAVQWHPRGSAA